MNPEVRKTQVAGLLKSKVPFERELGKVMQANPSMPKGRCEMMARETILGRQNADWAATA